MEKTALGFIAALGAAAVAPAAAQASAPATDRILNPASIAELLEPVANPVATLDDLQQRQLEAVEASDAQVAEIVVVRHRHHHHHVVILQRHHHHHFFHHHHHHHNY